MSDWFFMLGESLNDAERGHVREYLSGLGIEDDIPVVSVADWRDARHTISYPGWDRRWWDAEQAEKRRLQQKARATMTQTELMTALSRTVEQASETMHGAAAVEAARRGCSDEGLIRAAAGAASEALYHAELARLSGEDEHHPFRLKQSLFAGGHWPLGIVDGRYYVF
jgi:hypothetical protein